MLQALVHFSLRFKGIVTFLACLLIAYGIYTTIHAKQDVFPDFVPPEIVVQTEAPGFSPDQVEQLVTRPVENAVNAMNDLDTLRSDTIQGLSVVTAVFKDGTDIFRARQALAERLSELSGELPTGVKAPKMEPLTSSTMDLLKFGITSDKRSAMELRSFADFVLKPAILSVPGVAKCSTYGGEVRELQIQIDPEAMQARGVSIQDVVAAARDSIGIRGAGFIETTNQRIVIQAETTEVAAETLGEVVVAAEGGHAVRLKDVAKVAVEAEPKVGEAVINGEPGVLLTMSSQFDANTMEATKLLEEKIESMTEEEDGVRMFKGEGEDIVYHPAIHRPATFITSSIRNVEHSLLLGGALVAVVLFLILFNIRTALISLTAIPLSLLTAVILLDRFHLTLNTITLGGLAIAIGEVVDDAIIDVENIYRRLRENKLAAQPKPLFDVVFHASMEVRSAVVYATFVVILVFVPVLTMSGLEGKFFAPLGWAYIIAILASLGVALTVTPALSLLFFSRGTLKPHDPPLQRALKGIYSGMLKPLLNHAWVMVCLVAVICVAVVTSLFFFTPEYIPEFKEGHFVVGLEMGPGTSISEMRRMGEQMVKTLQADPHTHIKSIGLQIGRAELGEDTWGPEKGELHINLVDGVTAAQQTEAEKAINGDLDLFPGLQHEPATTFLGDRIGESITGEHEPIVVNLFGNNLDDLDEAAATVQETLESMDGHGEVAIKLPPKGPTLVVRPKDRELVRYGFRRMDVLEAVRIATAGEIVGQQFDGNRVSDVAVILQPKSRQTPEQMGELVLQNDQGVRRRLDELADVYQTTARNMISHERALRRQVVTCAPEEEEDLATFEAEAREKLEGVELPEGVQMDIDSETESATAARNQLLLHGGIAVSGILILLAMVFRSGRNLLLLLLNLPFAVVGGIVAVLLVKGGIHFAEGRLGSLSIGEIVGFVTLFGITTRNSIMLISHYEHLVTIDGLPWNRETALRGAAERLAPILMTALVTALGLLPLALGSGEAGREIEGPMAIVIVGGLVSSTLLNLMVMPTLALRFARFRAPTV